MKIVLHFWLLILISGLMLTACNNGEINSDHGQIQLNVSGLKSKLTLAIVIVYDSDGISSGKAALMLLAKLAYQ